MLLPAVRHPRQPLLYDILCQLFFIALCVCALVFSSFVLSSTAQGRYPFAVRHCCTTATIPMILPWVSHDAHADFSFGLCYLSSYGQQFWASPAVIRHWLLPIHPDLSSPTTSFSPHGDLALKTTVPFWACAPYPSLSARIEVGLNGPESRAPARTIMLRSLHMIVHSVFHSIVLSRSVLVSH